MYGFEDKISEADDLAKQQFGNNKGRKDHIEAWLIKHGENHKVEKAKRDPSGAVVALGEINHSRAIAKCPYCGGAEAVNPHGNEGFYCLSCLNYQNGGEPISIQWNWNYNQVANELEKRPNPANRNCLPTETLEMIQAENLAHGLSKKAGK